MSTGQHFLPPQHKQMFDTSIKINEKSEETHYNALIPFEILTDQGFLFIWKNNYENLQPFKKKTFNAFLYFYMTQFGVKFSRLHSSTYQYFYFRVTYWHVTLLSNYLCGEWFYLQYPSDCTNSSFALLRFRTSIFAARIYVARNREKVRVSIYDNLMVTCNMLPLNVHM